MCIRDSLYRQYENELSTEGIDYQVSVNKIKKFEKQNVNISVNVFGYESEINESEYRKDEVYPCLLYTSRCV